jgi:hypothetical protein
MSRYEYDAHSTSQAQRDLARALHLIAEYAATHPGQRITCRLVVDLPEPAPDYDQPRPA